MSDDNSKKSESERDLIVDSLKQQLEDRLHSMQRSKTSGGSAKTSRPVSARSGDAGKGAKVNSRLRVRDITAFCEELALLLEAGMALVPAMRTLSARTGNQVFARVISDMADRVERGASFTQAASFYAPQFGKHFIGIFQAGENSGTLVSALRRVAYRGEHMMRTRYRLLSALIYPAIIVGASILVIVFAFSYAMSHFQPVIEELGAAVPWTMQALLGFGQAVRTPGFWITLFVILAILVAGYLTGMKFFAFRLVRDRILIRLPFVERFVKQGAVSDFGRIFSTMIQAGVSLPEALEAAGETTKNEVVRLAVDRTLETVKEGGRVVPPLVREKIFPPLAYDMLEVAEETGELGEVFERIADIYEEKEENDLEIVGKIIQPAIIIFLALIVGFVVISLFQTYATIIEQVSGGV